MNNIIPTPDSATPTRRPPSIWRMAWRQTARDFRAGELRLLIVAVMLAVAALTAVGFFADRINNGLARDARQMLGGDAIVASDQPAPPTFTAKARELGLATATTTSFPSMGRATDALGGASRLVAVKAVSDAYPLCGRLRLNAGRGSAEVSLAAAPEAGSVWVDAGLLDALNLKIGDPLLLGDASLRIAQVIVIEPDRGAGFMSFAPRVMLNVADLEATGLIQPATMLVGNLNFIAISVLGGIRVANGAMTIGEIQAFLQYSRSFSQPLAWIASMVNMFQSGIASAERVFEFLDADAREDRRIGQRALQQHRCWPQCSRDCDDRIAGHIAIEQRFDRGLRARRQDVELQHLDIDDRLEGVDVDRDHPAAARRAGFDAGCRHLAPAARRGA